MQGRDWLQAKRSLQRRWPRLRSSCLPLLGVVSVFGSVVIPSYTETAVANGDTRTIHLYHVHTHESIDATYRVNGEYDPAVLKQLNWFLRDWRRDEPTSMDPRLFDVVWEVYRSAGAGASPVTVMSAYRSPETNAMLRRRSRAVAEHSQHMLGKAMDTSMPGMSMEQIRETGMRFQRGGVGYYPTAGTPFVHLDVGSVRSWPRMSYDQLVSLFPDGKTVHLPSNGQPLARYEEARAEIAANGGAIVPPSSRSSGFFAWLFGGGNGAADDEDSSEQAPAPSRATRGRRGAVQMASMLPRGRASAPAVGAAPSSVGSDDSGRDFAIAQANRRAPDPVPAAQAVQAQVARAETNLPRGETYMAPTAQSAAAAAQPVASRTQVASLAPDQQVAAQADADTSPVASIAPDHPPPPRRPADLFAFYGAPMPPARPVELASLAPTALPQALPATASAYAGADIGLRRDPIASLLGNPAVAPTPRAAPKAAAHPANTSGTNVAALGPITGLRAGVNRTSAGTNAVDAPPVVPARLDRTNFRAMTAQGPATHMTTQSVSGPTLIAARSAARGNAAALLTPGAAVVSQFGVTATDLPTSSFSATSGSSRQQRASR